MRRLLVVLTLLTVVLIGGEKAKNQKQAEESTQQVKAQSKISLDGLKLGMTKDEVFKIKFSNNAPKLSSLSYIEKLYYGDMGEGLEKDFYIYEAKIADEMAYIWLWFTKETNELYAMRVEWRNKQNIYEIKNDVHAILTEKYGVADRETWKLGDIEIIEKLARVSVDNTYFRDLVSFTYINTKLKKMHEDSIIPYKRPTTGL